MQILKRSVDIKVDLSQSHKSKRSGAITKLKKSYFNEKKKQDFIKITKLEAVELKNIKYDKNVDFIRFREFVKNKVFVCIYNEKKTFFTYDKIYEKSNAENNKNMTHSKLYVAEIYSNQGPTLKRIRPAAKGSAVRIRKRTSHTTIVLKERD